MATFGDLETYCAVSRLAQTCRAELEQIWRSRSSNPHDANPFGRLAKEFAEAIRSRAPQCDPRDARRWCAAMRGGLFQAALCGDGSASGQTPWNELLEAFSVRIQRAIAASAYQPPEALEWIGFIEDNATAENRTWAETCLEVAADAQVPDCVFQRAIEVLERLTPDHAKTVATVVRRLGDLRPPDGTNLWARPAFRSALMATLVRSETWERNLRQCLGDVKNLILRDVDEFGKFTAVFNELRDLNVAVEGPYEPAAAGGTGAGA